VFSSHKTREMSWAGEFGDKYIDRNQELSNFQYGDTDRLTITKSFFDKIPRDASILEIGCNIGSIIRILESMGFTDVTGIDINEKAIKIISKAHPQYKFIHTSIENYEPHRTFDMVYTSGVLIHMTPEQLPRVVEKMERLSRKWIFGFEYYAEGREFKIMGYAVPCYQGDFASLFKGRCVRTERHTARWEHVYYLIKRVY